jgi:hypothetical protein
MARLRARTFPALAAALGLAACASVPTGPSVMVLPGTGKSFEQFRRDESACRQFAHEQSGGRTPARAQEDSALKSAAVGTAVGALAGAAIGGDASSAAVGAGIGLLGGSLAGAGAAERSARAAQRRYDIAYQQCLYAKGHQIPLPARLSYRSPVPAHGPPFPPPPPPAQSVPR